MLRVLDLESERILRNKVENASNGMKREETVTAQMKEITQECHTWCDTRQRMKRSDEGIPTIMKLPH